MQSFCSFRQIKHHFSKLKLVLNIFSFSVYVFFRATRRKLGFHHHHPFKSVEIAIKEKNTGYHLYQFKNVRCVNWFDWELNCAPSHWISRRITIFFYKRFWLTCKRKWYTKHGPTCLFHLHKQFVYFNALLACTN